MPIAQSIQELSPGDIVTLIEVDLTSIGDNVYYFHNGTNELNAPVVWQGNSYVPFPLEISGFESSTQGTLARPILKLANVTGVLIALLQGLGDMVGGKITRRRTMAKYLDAVNFTGGINANADPTASFPEDTYFIDRKTSENKIFIEFELVSSLDINGIQLPRRQIIQNSCTWIYRSAECTYAGVPIADSNDNSTTDPLLDVCGKRLNSCQLRFPIGVIPYGGFPGSGLLS